VIYSVEDLQGIGTDHRSTPESSSDSTWFVSKDRRLEIGVENEEKAIPDTVDELSG
jgi:hypothetical protein